MYVENLWLYFRVTESKMNSLITNKNKMNRINNAGLESQQTENFELICEDLLVSKREPPRCEVWTEQI